MDSTWALEKQVYCLVCWKEIFFFFQKSSTRAVDDKNVTQKKLAVESSSKNNTETGHLIKEPARIPQLQIGWRVVQFRSLRSTLGFFSLLFFLNHIKWPDFSHNTSDVTSDFTKYIFDTKCYFQCNVSVSNSALVTLGETFLRTAMHVPSLPTLRHSELKFNSRDKHFLMHISLKHKPPK